MAEPRASLERAETELVALRKVANELARERKERVTTVHLLAAMSSRGGPVADLLAERRLGAEALLKAGRSFDENDTDAFHRATQEAKEIAQRARASQLSSPDAKPTLAEPSAVHLLFALLSDRRCAAHRALLQCGVDVGRLRTATLQISIGFVTPRRSVAPRPSPLDVPLQGRGRGPGSVVPVKLVPRPAPKSSPPPPPSSAPAPTTSSSSSPSSAVAVPFMRPQRPEHGRPMRVGPRRAHPAPAKPQSTKEPAREDEAKPQELVVLRSVSRDLGVLALEGAFDHLVGRDEEIDRALDVLAREASNVACFVGRSGSGTTSAALATAKRLLAEDRVLHELSLPLLSRSPGVRAHLAALRAELAGNADHVALFIDDLYEMSQLGDDVAQELRLLFTTPDLRVVTTASPEHLRRLHELCPSVARCLSPVEVDEPDVESAFLMTRARAGLLGAHHGLGFSDEAVAAAIGWCKRYVAGRALPEKAVSVLDLAGARTKRRSLGKTVEVEPEMVAEIVSELTEVPVERLLQQDRERMIKLEAEIGKRVIGHTDAIARISARIRQNAAGLAGDRPIGSFLLLGPTGVGKTETAKAIAHVLFGSSSAMTRVDMSEYAESHAVARLIGAPPGYVGHESGGQLTEALRLRPYQVVLLDEIEKAHRDVLEAFLQVLDEGHLTDGRGRKVDFKNAVIVLTSNLGAREVESERTKRSVGFAGSAPASRDKLEQTSIAAARKELPPELWNRLDEALFFAPLERTDVASIAKLLVDELRTRLSQRGVEIDVQPEVIDVLLDSGGYDASLGARPMRRTLSRLVEAPLADLVLRGELDDGRVALVGVERGEISIDAVDGPARIRAQRGSARNP